MRLSDVEQVAALDAHLFRSTHATQWWAAEVTQKKNSFPFVLEFHNFIVGYAVCRLAAGEVEIIQLAVDARFRRQRFASELLRHITTEMRKRAATVMHLEVRKSNIAAQRLYLKFGFRQTGLRPNYYADNREDAILMSLNLRREKDGLV